MVETVVTTIEDEFNFYVKKYLSKKEFLTILVCIILFCLCLPNICPGGIYYFTIVDFFSAGISVFYIAFFEVIAIVYFYGGKRLSKNITIMTGSKPNKFILICWYVVSPVFIFGIWIFSWIEYTPISYGKYQYSAGAMTFGWCIALVSIIAIPASAVHTLYKTTGKSFTEKLKLSIKPTINDLNEKFTYYSDKSSEDTLDIKSEEKIKPLLTAINMNNSNLN